MQSLALTPVQQRRIAKLAQLAGRTPQCEGWVAAVKARYPSRTNA